MHLGVPFIAPRQLGAVEDQIGRQFLPSVRWRTGQSGAPPDMNSSCSMLAKPTVGSSDPLVHCPVHTGQSGVTIRPLAWPRIVR
jgi:hypothetical protein